MSPKKVQVIKTVNISILVAMFGFMFWFSEVWILILPPTILTAIISYVAFIKKKYLTSLFVVLIIPILTVALVNFYLLTRFTTF